MKDIKRVILKLSGEALSGDKKSGYDDELIIDIARQVSQIIDKGINVGVVIGGGNYWRGRSNDNIDRTKADQIGMLATIMNCIYVSEIFRSQGIKTNILTPFECGSMTKLFSKDRANKYFEKGMVVFFAGGTGHPYFSTDTGIVVVDNDGVITTVGPGEAEVVVESDNAGVSSSCIVHSLAISKSYITLEQYDQFWLDVIGTSDNVIWRSSNPRVCTITQSGAITARKAGTTTVTAVVDNKTLTCTVKVTNFR